MDTAHAFYSGPSYLYRGGGGFPVFAGSRRQRGGSLLGSLAKMVMPVLGAVGKAALNQAAGLAGDLVDDARQGLPFRQSLKRRGLNRLHTTLRALPHRRRQTLIKGPVKRPATSKATTHKRPLGKRPSVPLKKSPPQKRTRNF